ncbi:MAG TPA: response regulator, partial [Aggregatilineales bacterium]|nr:response regulator [Aggregatilineales bacterium]
VTNPSLLDATLNQAGAIRVIFLDLEMPDIDGYQVLQKLKADSRFVGVPIVAYTVHVSEVHVAYENGFDGFLGKPIDSDKFPDQLARILMGEAVWE